MRSAGVICRDTVIRDVKLGDQWPLGPPTQCVNKSWDQVCRLDRSERFLVVRIQNAELKANTMFRFSLIVCVSVIYGITAKPYKSWDEPADEAFQDTIMYKDDKGKISWGIEVEPPEDMDRTDYDIDPQMKIWKSMTGGGQDQQPLKAEEDLDELYHPSVAHLLKVQIQDLDAHPAANIQAEYSHEEADIKYNQEPEDKDDVDHPVFIKVASEEPEQDWDEVSRKAREELYGYLAPLVAGYKAGAEVRVAHSEPEEDMDDLYHKDVLKPIPYQVDTRAAVPADLPFPRKHSEPEEDLDDLYHL
ncbi:uncharacterized protein si:ch211-217g15.3 isoform X2 [Micropterus salmoides]|uniref:uncharacterized protein si:ch211-217g15.3 isoform X2 n=1 Tax=Micropterus salmoides TaxID=27706 RepID=UPI0018EB0579|nr:uncharacterized protein si:ch211-217g15.3 isoform X2 [Micropterus salmoides]